MRACLNPQRTRTQARFPTIPQRPWRVWAAVLQRFDHPGVSRPLLHREKVRPFRTTSPRTWALLARPLTNRRETALRPHLRIRASMPGRRWDRGVSRRSYGAPKPRLEHIVLKSIGLALSDAQDEQTARPPKVTQQRGIVRRSLVRGSSLTQSDSRDTPGDHSRFPQAQGIRADPETSPDQALRSFQNGGLFRLYSYIGPLYMKISSSFTA